MTLGGILTLWVDNDDTIGHTCSVFHGVLSIPIYFYQESVYITMMGTVVLITFVKDNMCYSSIQLSSHSNIW